MQHFKRDRSYTLFLCHASYCKLYFFLFYIYKSNHWLCVLLLQVDLIRPKRGTRFYRGEPDRQSSRRMLLIIHVKNPPPSLDTSCEPNHTCACFFLPITPPQPASLHITVFMLLPVYIVRAPPAVMWLGMFYMYILCACVCFLSILCG